MFSKKSLYVSLLSALLGSTAAFAAPIPAELAGSYQALLSADSPAGLVALKVTTKGAVTGKLTTPAKKVYSFKTTLDYTAGDDLGTEGTETGVATHAEPIAIKVGKDIPDLNLSLTFRDFADSDTLEATLEQDEETLGSTEEGFKVKTYAKGEAVEVEGSYTIAFEYADEPGASAPSGLGYAAATVSNKGLMKLTGKLGDGTKLTASLAGGGNNEFALFVNPYKRDGSYFAGMLVLEAREGGGFQMLPETANIAWNKTAGAKDKSYSEGFGPEGLNSYVLPWTAPGKGENVAGLFGIVDGRVFTIDYGFEVPAGREADYISINDKNGIYAATGQGTLDPSAFAKIFSGKVNPKNGVVTATLNLEDSVLVNNRPKTIKRKVVIEGVMLDYDSETETDTFAAGFALLPPLEKGDPITSHSVLFGDIQDDPVAQEFNASGFELAGDYQAYFDWEHDDPNLTPPSSIPDNGALVVFNISADVKTLSFNGRTLKLESYTILPGSISTVVYKDMKKITDNIVATIRFTNAGMIKCDVSYTQVKGRSARFRSALSRNNPNTIVKLP